MNMNNLYNYSDDFDFLSIVIAAYNRYEYLEECVDSIHEHADFPVEIIIHDDNSEDGTKEKIYRHLSDKVSSIIFNNGYSMGLAESINRAVGVSGSNYILMLNADLRIERPFFHDLVNILKLPFSGYITPMNHDMGKGFCIRGTKCSFARIKCSFARGMGAGCSLAFRKDNWYAVGKFNNNTCSSSNVDVSFISRMLRNGYFPMSLHADKPGLSNMSNDRCKGEDSTIARQKHDCSFPKLYCLKADVYDRLCDIHKDRCDKQMQISYRKEDGETNINYWDAYPKEIINEDMTINWEVAKRHGQYKWKDMIELILTEEKC